ncbi:MAG: long-chain fatty acid--CoA ligase [Tetrasphaera sp.]
MSFNLSVIVREAARRTPDHVAVIFDGGELTYRELDKQSDRVARNLLAEGLQRGGAVGLQLPNVPEFLVAFYGIIKAGGFMIPMNTLNKGPEIEYFLQLAGADFLITDVSCADEAHKGLTAAGANHLYVRGEGDLPEGARPFSDLLAGEDSGPDPFAATEPTDIAVLLYTSGTTGKPKGVKLTHFQLYMNADAHRTSFNLDGNTVTIAVMPLFHALGLSGILNATVLGGGAVRLLAKFDPTRVLEVIQSDKATVLHGVPTMYHALLHHPERTSYDTSTLLACGSAGAAIAAELLDEIEKALQVSITEMYGLTESGPLATANVPGDRRAYSIGKPIWGTEVQIWDDDGNRLPRGKDHVGEIVIRGHNEMGGYLHNDQATAEAFTGGWLHSGDLGYEDEDGFFFVVDRKKELIIRGGYNVYPREIEEVLYQHPAVSEAAVIGKPNDRLGEEVAAFVALKPGFDPSPEEIIEFVKARVAAYKYPRTVTFLSELPKGPTGKILKRELLDVESKA